jgi:ligand-binding sensor domain-containing protein
MVKESGINIRNRISIFILIVMLFTISNNSFANNELWFRSLTIKDGLSGSDVECLLQDSRGLIWVGTREGLNVYDGYEFKQISNTSRSSTSKYVTSLFEDINGNIWVGYLSGGICIYNYSQENFSEIKVSKNLKTDFTELSVW